VGAYRVGSGAARGVGRAQESRMTAGATESDQEPVTIHCLDDWRQKDGMHSM
jgi:hypothetical protein